MCKKGGYSLRRVRPYGRERGCARVKPAACKALRARKGLRSISGYTRKYSRLTKKNKILANLAKTCKNWQEFKIIFISLWQIN